jgi:Zn-dependent protease
MLIFRFGWSKPVPINEYNFKKRELGTMLTALAGPVSNFILAGLTALIYHIFKPDYGSLVELILYTFTVINLSLGIFNLIPIPPLDGHKIVRGLLPKKIRYYWDSLEKYSLILIILLVLPFSPLSTFISNGISSVLTFSLNLLGFL